MTAMIRLDELFELKNGLASGNVTLLPERTKTSIPYLRPAKTQQRTVAGWVEISTVPVAHRHPVHSIFISTDGEGSHTYAYVSDFEFVANSNVTVLEPKREMSLLEKVFYARAITANRPKFSYGRKPKGERLKAIELPEQAPSWIGQLPIDLPDKTKLSVINSQVSLLETKKWKPFFYNDLFTVKKGQRLTKAEMMDGSTPYIGSSDANNGLTAMIGQQPIHEANTISLSYNGSVGEAFYQPKDFWATDDVNVLYPRFRMNSAIALFICALIRKEKYRFNYGRKWTLDKMNKSIIKLPVKNDDSPDFDFMENYIKSLPYSSQL